MATQEQAQRAKRNIVIVGGGVGGIGLATRLTRSSRLRQSARVTSVDRGLSHYWKPALHTFTAGTRRPNRQKTDFLSLAHRCGFRFWPGVLTGVDREMRRITLEPDRVLAEPVPNLPPDVLDYDVLVLAIGSRANDFGALGVDEHCLTIDDLTGAELFRAHLRRQVFASMLSGAPLQVAIVGGGPAGVELAAELKQALDLLANDSASALVRGLELTLVDHGQRLLATIPESTSKAAIETLQGLSVKVRSGVGIAGADENGLIIEGGGRIDASLRIWAAGVKAPDVLGAIAGLKRTRSGQLKVSPTFQTTADPAIFAFGDCAAMLDPTSGKGLPATAQVAHEQAAHLAKHLDPDDFTKLKPFRYRDLGLLVALGDYGGWGTIGRVTFGGRVVQGLAARWAHDLLYRQHQVGVLGPVRGLLGAATDTLDAVVSPRPARPVSQMGEGKPNLHQHPLRGHLRECEQRLFEGPARKTLKQGSDLVLGVADGATPSSR